MSTLARVAPPRTIRCIFAAFLRLRVFNACAIMPLLFRYIPPAALIPHVERNHGGGGGDIYRLSLYRCRSANSAGVTRPARRFSEPDDQGGVRLTGLLYLALSKGSDAAVYPHFTSRIGRRCCNALPVYSARGIDRGRAPRGHFRSGPG